MHKAGFVNIIGNPNVGKSTLMNSFVGEKLSIITSKAQTTRHRILGIVNGDDFQMVISDTPGIIKPVYELQSSMMDFVKAALDDADVLVYMVEIGEKDLKDENTADQIKDLYATRADFEKAMLIMAEDMFPKEKSELYDDVEIELSEKEKQNIKFSDELEKYQQERNKARNKFMKKND